MGGAQATEDEQPRVDTRGELDRPEGFGGDEPSMIEFDYESPAND